MQHMTLEQLRTASEAGGVADVTLKAQGGAFLVEVVTRSGSGAVLCRARSHEPRRFGNLAAALNTLRGIGISTGRFDASAWDPKERIREPGNRGRAESMREAHRAAAYNRWLIAEIQRAVDDARPSVPHEEVMAGMDAEIAALPATRPHRKRPRAGT